jgi:hypothetical protein
LARSISSSSSTRLSAPARSRPERDAAHLLGPLAHLGEHLDEGRVGIDVGDELRELRHRDAAVGRPLEQEVDVQDREDEPKIPGHGGLERQQRLDLALDLEKQAIDLVVEGDDLVGQLDVALLQGPNGSANCREDALALFLELRLDPVEAFVDRHGDTVYRLDA